VDDLTDQTDAKRAWEPATLTYVGNVAAVLQMGGGKLSQILADSGEAIRKTRPSG